MSGTVRISGEERVVKAFRKQNFSDLGARLLVYSAIDTPDRHPSSGEIIGNRPSGLPLTDVQIVSINVNTMSNFIFKVEMKSRLQQPSENKRVLLSDARRLFENEAAHCVSLSLPDFTHTSPNLTSSRDSRLFIPGVDSDFSSFSDRCCLKRCGGFLVCASHFLVSVLTDL